MDIQHRHIEVFRAVMQAGSVTAAAERLHVSQPGVSRLLAHLELQLGVGGGAWAQGCAASRACSEGSSPTPRRRKA